jgi:hypothetical protein
MTQEDRDLMVIALGRTLQALGFAGMLVALAWLAVALDRMLR